MSEQGADDVSQRGSQYLLHLYRGSDFLLKEQVVEARQELEEASRIDPEDPKGLSLLGLVYFRLDEFERAQQIYELLVARYPMEAPLRVNLGLVYMKQGRDQAARDEMLRALEIDPNHQRAFGYMGLLYSESGDHERARVAFAKAGQDAMVQRMDELIAARAPDAQTPPGAVSSRAPAAQTPPGAGPPKRSAVDTQKVWVAFDASDAANVANVADVDEAKPPEAPLEPPPLTVPGLPSPFPGAPGPLGAMTPMMSDVMTQPVAVPTFAPQGANQAPLAGSPTGGTGGGTGAGPATSQVAEPGADVVRHAAMGSASELLPGEPQFLRRDTLATPTVGGAMFPTPEPVAWDAGAASPAGLAWPAEDTAPPVPQDPQAAQAAQVAQAAQAPQELSEEELDAAFGEPAAVEQAPPQGIDLSASPVAMETASAPAGAEDPLGVPPPFGEAASFIAEGDVNEALDRAVGPAEPWPAGGVPSTAQSVRPGTIFESGEDRSRAQVTGYASPMVDAPPGGGVEPMPIFAFATTGLVDLGARYERMTSTPEGLLLMAVEEDGYFRAESLLAKVGDLKIEPAFRRNKGANTDEPMEDRRGRFVKARGEGLLLCSPGADRLIILDLFDDFIYVRSEHLFAFESTLHWENGKIRGHLGAISLVHVRGEGRLVLACDPGIRKLRLVPDVPALVAESALVGWVGRVIPQIVPRSASLDDDPLGTPLLRCEGEGVLLVLPQRVTSGSWVGAPPDAAG